MTMMIKVRDMPFEVANACRELGCTDDQYMQISEALARWSQWELGDGYWGSTAAFLVGEMLKTLESQNDKTHS